MNKEVLKKNPVIFKIGHRINLAQNVMRNRSYVKALRKKYGNSADPEIQNVLNHITFSNLTFFNYTFTGKYKLEDYLEKIHRDSEGYFYYISEDGDRVFFPLSFTKEQAASYIMNIELEQDRESPHCYTTVDIPNPDIVIDAGCSECLFSSRFIHTARKIVLIEGASEWKAPIQKTFAGADNIILYNKFLGDKEDDTYITIDSIMDSLAFEGDERVLIKMDIEGWEPLALMGGQNTLRNSRKLCVLACSYHYEGEENEISNIMNGMGLTVNHTKGYMFFPPEYEKTVFSHNSSAVLSKRVSLRRAIIYGRRG